MLAHTLLIGLMGAVALILVVGVVTLARGSAKTESLSNKLMVARVAVQAVAVLLVVLMMLARG